MIPVLTKPMSEAEQKLQEYLKDGPKAELSMVEEMRAEGQTAEQILDFLLSFA